MTAPDLARDLMTELTSLMGIGPWGDRAEMFILAKLTLSRTAGRAEGLEEAAQWHEAEANHLAEVLRRATGDGSLGAREKLAWAKANHETFAADLRALASDPAPGEQVAETPLIADRIFDNRRAWNLLDSQLYDVLTAAGIAGYAYQDWHFDDYDSSIEFDGCNADFKLTKEHQTALWALGFDRCWLNHKDSMESFYSKTSGEHYRYAKSRPAPAHPTEPGEVERELEALAAEFDSAGESHTWRGATVAALIRKALSTPQPKGEMS